MFDAYMFVDLWVRSNELRVNLVDDCVSFLFSFVLYVFYA